MTGRDVNVANMCRLLHHHNFTQKKFSIAAKQSSKLERVTYIAQMTIYPLNCLIWIDETAFDRKILLESIDMH